MKTWQFQDNSTFWKIMPWRDGSFGMENWENGSAWYLDVLDSNLMAMSSNITGRSLVRGLVFWKSGLLMMKNSLVYR
jgi:hypothetical protein